MKRDFLELRRELVGVEHRLRRLERELLGYSKVDEIKNELKKEFPSLEFDDDLFELVGGLPSTELRNQSCFANPPPSIYHYTIQTIITVLFIKKLQLLLPVHKKWISNHNYNNHNSNFWA